VGAGLGAFLREGAVARSDLWVTSKARTQRARAARALTDGGLARTHTLHAPAAHRGLTCALTPHCQVANPSIAARRVQAACRDSLRRLGVSQLDLYLVHSPFPDVPLRDTWREMEALVDAGLTRHIGVSNFRASDITELLSFARIRPVVNQIEARACMRACGASSRWQGGRYAVWALLTRACVHVCTLACFRALRSTTRTCSSASCCRCAPQRASSSPRTARWGR
jgi:aryl-alcohol dehydrogenase-like predicted oxidoreductase